MFNSSKYQLLNYSTNRKSIENTIHNNQIIECQSFATHLGHTIGPYSNTKAVQGGIDMFIISLNGNMASCCDAYVDVKYKLFKTYCMSLHACVLWDLDSSFISKYYVSCRKGIRKLLGLPL